MSDPMRALEKFRYELLTWPEINQAVQEGRVVILPTGAVEQHGHHLPLDVDIRLAYSVCLEAGRRAPDKILVMPPVNYGYCHHVMDFPGTINIQMKHFIDYCLDITKSLAYHGFKRIVIVNGHGSNLPLVHLVGRKTVLLTDALCAAFGWWQVADEAYAQVREATFPGGCAHACEMETSMYLYLNEAYVYKDKICDDMPPYLSDPETKRWYAIDNFGGEPTSLIHWTSTYTKTGTIGEATPSSREKGRIIFEGAVTKLVEFVTWFKEWQNPPRVDHHSVKPTMDLPFSDGF